MNKHAIKQAGVKNLAVRGAIFDHAAGHAEVALAGSLTIMAQHVQHDLFLSLLQGCRNIFVSLVEFFVVWPRTDLPHQPVDPVQMKHVITVRKQFVEASE